MTNRYYGKTFSVFGDSISTLRGYGLPGYAVFYEGPMLDKSGVWSAEDTWWGEVIETLGGRLLVNASWSGSLVSLHDEHELRSSGCRDERIEALSKDGADPDVILLHMGTNDWANSVKVRPETEAEENDLHVFKVSYPEMLRKLRARYPHAEIWCITPGQTTCRQKKGYVFPYRFKKNHIADYVRVIEHFAGEFDCTFIDLYDRPDFYDSIDGVHPNAAGMRQIARDVLHAVGK